MGEYRDGTAYNPTQFGNPAQTLVAESLAFAPAAATVMNRETGILSGADRYDVSIVNHGRLEVMSRPGEALAVAGDFAQGPGGRLVLIGDVAAGSEAPALRIGGRAIPGGTLEVAPVRVVPGTETPVLMAAGGIEGGFGTVRFNLFTFEQHMGASALAISPASADFSPDGLTLDEQKVRIADHLDGAFDAGRAMATRCHSFHRGRRSPERRPISSFLTAASRTSPAATRSRPAARRIRRAASA